MERRHVNLLLVVTLVSGAVTAQTQEEIATAITRLDGERLDARAMEFLIDTGEPTVAAIVAQLKAAPEDPGNPKFARMLRVLRAIGPAAVDALDDLMTLLCDKRLLKMVPLDSGRPGGRIPDDQRALLGALGQSLSTIVPFAPERAASLRKQLYDAPLAHAVQFYGAVPDHGCHRLVLRLTYLESPEPRDSPRFDAPSFLAREFAADSLVRGDRDRIPALIRLLQDNTHPEKSYAELPPTFREARIVIWQTGANHIVWNAASKAIARIDPDHPEAVRGLARMLESADDPRDRVRAAAALGRHGEATTDHVDVLIAALDSDDDRLVAEAVTALGMVGVANDEVLDRLRDLSSDDRPAIARRAEVTLRSLEEREGDK